MSRATGIHEPGADQTTGVSILLTAPIGLNEMVLAVWLIVKGFDTPTIASEPGGFDHERERSVQT
jgi:hypothetical protein